MQEVIPKKYYLGGAANERKLRNKVCITKLHFYAIFNFLASLKSQKFQLTEIFSEYSLENSSLFLLLFRHGQSSL